MSALETQGNLSEDKAEQEQDVNEGRLIPIGESIRYRKRAQSAERRAEELAGELEQVRAEAEKLADELKTAQAERELTQRLAAAGVRDLETAMLVARTRMAEAGKADLDGVVEQLKKEKQYLFGEKAAIEVASRTSPAREQRGGAGTVERAAKRAAKSGSRADLQEYMKKRRNVV